MNGLHRGPNQLDGKCHQWRWMPRSLAVLRPVAAGGGEEEKVFFKSGSFYSLDSCDQAGRFDVSLQVVFSGADMVLS